MIFENGGKVFLTMRVRSCVKGTFAFAKSLVYKIILLALLCGVYRKTKSTTAQWKNALNSWKGYGKNATRPGYWHCFDTQDGFMVEPRPNHRALEGTFRPEVFKLLKECRLAAAVINKKPEWHNSSFNIFCSSPIEPVDQTDWKGWIDYYPDVYRAGTDGFLRLLLIQQVAQFGSAT